ncbi:MAG TPA: hypothetical protein VGS02_05430 [Acidobacteriaceae bacterium]|nr:hypothetical protein [Acidobacteriaceae bacterium]
MKRVFVGTILLLALLAFGLQPTKGKAVPVNLSALRAIPLTLGPFHAISTNDAELTGRASVTDGSVGLDRVYVNGAGTRTEITVIPQTIGQHVPLMCNRYGGYTIISETQTALPANPGVRFNRLTVRGSADHLVTTCLYYWKTADGVFVTRPNHSLGFIAVRWSDHQQGLFVNICAQGSDAVSPGTEQALQNLLDDSYPQIARAFPAVFRNSTKD